MYWTKKIAAAGMAVVMTVGLAACNTGEDTKWIAQSGNQTVPAGVYLGLMLSQYYQQTGKLTENEEGKLPEKPLKETIDGKSVSDLIIEGTRKDLDSYIASEAKFAELGLEISADKQVMAEQQIASYWSFLQDAYKENGISEQSYRLLEMNNFKKDALFQSIYGTEGTEPVSEAEFQEKFTNDYAKVMVVPLSLSSSEDAAEKEKADQTARDKIEEYYQMLESGKDMEDVVFQARKDTASDPSTVTQPEKGTSYTFVGRDQPIYEQEVMDAIFSAEIGKPFKIESEYSVYLFVRYDINENPADIEQYKASMTYQLREQAFETELADWATALSDVQMNEAALKRYTPDKLKI